MGKSPDHDARPFALFDSNSVFCCCSKTYHIPRFGRKFIMACLKSAQHNVCESSPCGHQQIINYFLCCMCAHQITVLGTPCRVDKPDYCHHLIAKQICPAASLHHLHLPILRSALRLRTPFRPLEFPITYVLRMLHRIEAFVPRLFVTHSHLASPS